MLKYTKCSFSIKVNVREEIEEFFPRMWKINQDKRRLMKSIKDQKIKIEWGKKIEQKIGQIEALEYFFKAILNCLNWGRIHEV